jgi:hypothetical protein
MNVLQTLLKNDPTHVDTLSIVIAMDLPKQTAKFASKSLDCYLIATSSVPIRRLFGEILGYKALREACLATGRRLSMRRPVPWELGVWQGRIRGR